MIWCIMLAVVGIGVGAFIAGVHFVRAQERITKSMERELEELREQNKKIKSELTSQIEELQEELEKEKKKSKNLENQVYELEREIKERDEEIARLRRELAAKSQPVMGRRRARRTLLE